LGPGLRSEVRGDRVTLAQRTRLWDNCPKKGRDELGPPTGLLNDNHTLVLEIGADPGTW